MSFTEEYSYNKIVTKPALSKMASIMLPNGNTIVWCHEHTLPMQDSVKQLAGIDSCNTCINRASKYVHMAGPEGALFFGGESFPTGSTQIDQLHDMAIEHTTNNNFNMLLVCENTWQPPMYCHPRGKKQSNFYHWTIVGDKHTDPSEVPRMEKFWSKIQNSVIERLTKLMTPEARASMEIIHRLIENGTLKRPDYWKSTSEWLQGLYSKFPLHVPMDVWQKEALCIYAMATGNAHDDIHYNFQKAENFLNFMVMDSEQDIAREMDSRSNPRTNGISQAARAKASKGIESKFGVDLSWDGIKNKDDMDLYVETPWGKIYYGNKILPNDRGKQNFDAGINGDEAEPVECITLCDEIVGKTIRVLVDNYTRRTIGDIHCEVVINQHGLEPIVYPVVWPKDRRKGDLLFVCSHTFKNIIGNPIELSEKRAQAITTQSDEFTKLFGTPTSVVATTHNMRESDFKIISWNNNKNNVIMPEYHTPAVASQQAMNIFDSLVVSRIKNIAKKEKVFISQRVAIQPPSSVQDLISRLSDSKEFHDLSIHLPDHAPGYVTRIETASTKALKGGNIIYAPNYYDKISEHPIKPVKPGNSRLDSSWVGVRQDGHVAVQEIVIIDKIAFFVLDGAKLPNSPDFPLSAGFYPQDLSSDGYKHRSKWAFLNTTLKPLMPVITDIPDSYPMIGTFLTGDTATVFLDGQKLVLRV